MGLQIKPSLNHIGKSCIILKPSQASEAVGEFMIVLCMYDQLFCSSSLLCSAQTFSSNVIPSES